MLSYTVLHRVSRRRIGPSEPTLAVEPQQGRCAPNERGLCAGGKEVVCRSGLRRCDSPPPSEASGAPSRHRMVPEQVHWKERVAYGAGDLASCLYWNTFSLFLLIFYTDTFGIGPAAAGTMLLITRTVDAVFDPLMGMIGDRTRSRWGRFRPWLLWMCIPFAIAGVLTFTTPNLSPTGKLIYAYVTYALVMILYSAINIPYGALLGVITPDSDERTRLSTCRFFGAFAGNLIVQGTLLYLVAGFGFGNWGFGNVAAIEHLKLGKKTVGPRSRDHATWISAGDGRVRHPGRGPVPVHFLLNERTRAHAEARIDPVSARTSGMFCATGPGSC